MPPDPLSQLLQAWRHESPEAPRFNAGVWARLEADRANRVFFRWALPLAASVALCFGVGSAWRDSHRQHAEQMAAAYVRTVDPLQMIPDHE